MWHSSVSYDCLGDELPGVYFALEFHFSFVIHYLGGSSTCSGESDPTINMISNQNLFSEFWPLEGPARRPGLHVPPGLPWAKEDDYIYLLTKIGCSRSPPLPKATFAVRKPDGPYYQALVSRNFLLPLEKKKRVCICPTCCRRNGVSGEKMWADFGMKIRREKQRVRRTRKQEEDRRSFTRRALATSLATSTVERQFKEALKWTWLRGGKMPSGPAEYVRRLNRFRSAALVRARVDNQPFVSLMANGKVDKTPVVVAARATSVKQTKIRTANKSAKTDLSQALIGPRAQAEPELAQMERKVLLRQIRTSVLIEKNALRSSNPIDRSLAFERILEVARRDLKSCKSRVGDFRFNLSNRLQQSILAAAPLFKL